MTPKLKTGASSEKITTPNTCITPFSEYDHAFKIGKQSNQTDVESVEQAIHELRTYCRSLFQNDGVSDAAVLPPIQLPYKLSPYLETLRKLLTGATVRKLSQKNYVTSEQLFAKMLDICEKGLANSPDSSRRLLSENV